LAEARLGSRKSRSQADTEVPVWSKAHPLAIIGPECQAGIVCCAKKVCAGGRIAVTVN
jgi:hypothetical protein